MAPHFFRRRPVAIGLVVLLAMLARVASRAYDIRIASPISVVVLNLGGPTTQLRLGGRVGNWRSDDTIIFDSSINLNPAVESAPMI